MLQKEQLGKYRVCHPTSTTSSSVLLMKCKVLLSWLEMSVMLELFPSPFGYFHHNLAKQTLKKASFWTPFCICAAKYRKEILSCLLRDTYAHTSLIYLDEVKWEPPFSLKLAPFNCSLNNFWSLLSPKINTGSCLLEREERKLVYGLVMCDNFLNWRNGGGGLTSTRYCCGYAGVNLAVIETMLWRIVRGLETRVIRIAFCYQFPTLSRVLIPESWPRSVQITLKHLLIFAVQFWGLLART